MLGVLVLVLLLMLMLMLVLMLLRESVTWAAKVVNARTASYGRVRPRRWCGSRSLKTRMLTRMLTGMAQMRGHRLVVSGRCTHASIATGRVLTLAAERCIVSNAVITAQGVIDRRGTGVLMSMLMRMVLLQGGLGETSYRSFETKGRVSSCGIPRITAGARTGAGNVLTRTGRGGLTTKTRRIVSNGTLTQRTCMPDRITGRNTTNSAKFTIGTQAIFTLPSAFFVETLTARITTVAGSGRRAAARGAVFAVADWPPGIRGRRLH